MPYVRKRTSSNYYNRRFMNEDCLLSAAFETFSGRWTAQVLFCIHFGIDRFGAIKRRLPRMSDQILGLRLRHLAEQGLIVKRTEGEAPVPSPVYALTKKGAALIPIFDRLVEWESRP